MSINILESKLKQAVERRNELLHMVYTAWSSAKGAKDTTYLYNVQTMVKEYLEFYGSFGMIELDYSHGDYNVESIEKTLVTWYRKIEHRFAEWSIQANSELFVTLRAIRYDNIIDENGKSLSNVGYNDEIDYTNERLRKNDTLHNMKRKLKTDLIAYCKYGLFTVLASTIHEKDYRTLQGLYTDIMDNVRLHGNYFLALFAWRDFKQTVENLVKHSNKLTRYEKFRLSAGLAIEDNNEIRIKAARLSTKIESQAIAKEMMIEHITALPFEQRVPKIIYYKSYREVTSEPILKKDMIKQVKIESSFKNKKKRKSRKMYQKKPFTRNCTESHIELIESITLKKLKLSNPAKYNELIKSRDIKRGYCEIDFDKVNMIEKSMRWHNELYSHLDYVKYTSNKSKYDVLVKNGIPTAYKKTSKKSKKEEIVFGGEFLQDNLQVIPARKPIIESITRKTVDGIVEIGYKLDGVRIQ